MVKEIGSPEEFDEVLTHTGLVVVDFHATWCGPCKMIAPFLNKLEGEYPSAKFVKIDVDEVGALATKYDIASMPTVLFIKNGKEINRIIGANPSALKSYVAENA